MRNTSIDGGFSIAKLIAGAHPVPVSFLNVSFSLANLDLRQHQGQLRVNLHAFRIVHLAVPMVPSDGDGCARGGRLCYHIQQWVATIFDDNCLRIFHIKANKPGIYPI